MLKNFFQDAPSCHPSFPVHKMPRSMDYAPFFHSRTTAAPLCGFSRVKWLIWPPLYPKLLQKAAESILISLTSSDRVLYILTHFYFLCRSLCPSFIELAQSLISQLLFFWLALIELLMLPSPCSFPIFHTAFWKVCLALAFHNSCYSADVMLQNHTTWRLKDMISLLPFMDPEKTKLTCPVHHIR